jgi:hypothetical protein
MWLEPAPYQHYQKLLFTVSIPLCAGGAILNSLFIWSILRNKRLLRIDYSFNLNIAFSDLVLCVLYTVNSVFDVNTPAPRFGYLDCQLYGMFAQLFNNVSVSTVLFMVIYQYRRVVLGKKEPHLSRVIAMFLFIWLSCLLLSTQPLLFPDANYVYQPSGMWCGLNLVSTNPAAKLVAYANLIWYFGDLAVISFSYYCIWAKINRVKHASTVFDHVNAVHFEKVGD